MAPLMGGQASVNQLKTLLAVCRRLADESRRLADISRSTIATSRAKVEASRARLASAARSGGEASMSVSAQDDRPGVAQRGVDALTDAVLATLPGEAAIIDAAGTIVQINEAWACATRSAPADVQTALAVGASYLKACRG